MEAALHRTAWDLVLSDCSLPQFSGMDALRLLKAPAPDCPIIMVSGAGGDDLIVAALREGAHDYLLKCQLARLVPTVTRVIADAETKRDITRELLLEEQFSHAQRMDAFGQLAGGVAHDFNNILAVILLHLSLLQREPGLSARMRGRSTSSPPRPNAPPGRYVRLQVADTGCSMDAATQQRIFEPFFTTKPVGKGPGLGLATVFGIVKQHHGWVEVESEVGCGSVFRILLPFVEQAAPAVAATEASAPSRGTESILLVEDDACVRQVTALCLEHCGYKVTAADSGQAAFRLWEENRHEFDLLLTNVTMPGGISGLKLAEQLHRAKDSLKIIIMSGYNRGLLNSAPIPGDGVYLSKPVDAAKLMQTVRACLDARPAAPLGARLGDALTESRTLQ